MSLRQPARMRAPAPSYIPLALAVCVGVLSPPALAQTASDEIVVTGVPLGRSAETLSAPVSTLAGEDLIHRRHATLGETLAGEPGVSVDNFGGGAARPVIRGQTSPRVRSLSDGSEIHDASAISPDHAITTEPMLLRGVEVFRGPSALIYGGGIGGAVNLLDDKIPVAQPNNGVSGVAEGRLGSGDDEQTGVAGVTVGAGPFAFRAEGVTRDTEDYEVPKRFGEDRVHGSYNETQTYSLGGSLIGENGYLGLAYTRIDSTYGIPGHSHDYESCHPHGVTLHCGGHGAKEEDHDHAEEDHDHEEVPWIDLRSNRYDLRGEIRNPFAGIERIRVRGSYTDYEHDEVEAGAVSTTFSNEARDVRAEVQHAPVFGLHGAIGVQHGVTDIAAIGEEAFIPEGKTKSTALFILESIETGALRFDFAARQEWVDVDWNDIRTGAARSASYEPTSVSAGAIGTLGEGYSLALTLARTQRAPNVQELAARGIHLAANTFELGTPTLDTETAHSVELTLRKTAGDTTLTLGAYHIGYEDYIYAETLDQFEDFRLVRYAATDATFTGVDGEIRHELTDIFAVSAFGDYVRGEFDDGGNLPRIPAGRLGVRGEANLPAFSADIEYYRVFEQDKIAAFETETPGYNMLNVTLAYTLPFSSVDAEVYVRGSNLTNDLAFSHASFIKDVSPLRGRNLVLGVRAAF